MKVSEYIEQLQRLKELHGDLRVYKIGDLGFSESKFLPMAVYSKKITFGEFKGKIWDETMDESDRGEKVIRV